MVKEKQQNSHDTGAQGLRTDMQAQAKQERKFFEDCIVKIAKDKDRQAFISLFEHFAPRIKSFLIKGGVDAELADELAQETMLAVWNKAESYKPEFATASTWIFRIARNKKIDLFRKQNRYNVDLDALENVQSTDSPSENMSDIEGQDAIQAAIKSLPEEQMDLLKMSFFEEKSHSEISEETGIALGTVKSRIRLALERLRHKLGTKELWL